MKKSITRAWIVVLGATAFALAMRDPSTGVDADEPAALVHRNSQGIEVTPLPAWFTFEAKATIEKWVADSDVKAMTEHSWLLWAALTTPSGKLLDGKELAVFETWLDPEDVFAAPSLVAAAPSPARRFEAPRQRRHRPNLVAAADPIRLLSVTTKYSLEMQTHVRSKEYAVPARLGALNDGWGTTPVAQREVEAFPGRSVMLKPAWQIISGSEPTELAYWSGAANSTSPTAPGPSTWTKKVLVVPPGTAAPADPTLPTVGLDRFYSVRLSPAEAQRVGAAAGDFAILVGMHASTREIDNWTWQTSWWSFRKPRVPASTGGRVRAPFDNYELAVGYSFTNPGDSPTAMPTLCFNPYLEAGFTKDFFDAPGQSGIESNCMSCHRAAAWPSGKYVGNGLIDKADPFFFTGNTKTDFVWGFGRVAPP